MRNFVVTVNGKQYSVQVEETNVAQQVSHQAVKAPAMQAPTPVAAPSAPKVTAGGGNSLTAPLPGMILNFKVENGATVKKGDVVLILEAMKMENDVCATCDGVINFTVSKGANVNTGDTLATMS